MGHLNLIQRAADIFDELVVVVAENRQKRYLFTADERVSMIRELVRDHKNVTAVVWDSLIVDFLRREGIKILVRGVRGMEDFSYEFELSMVNKALDRKIETIFMTTDPEYFVLRSSSVKEIAGFHGDVSGMVPPQVARALESKYRALT